MTEYINLEVKCTGYYDLDGSTFKRNVEYNVRAEKHERYIQITKYDMRNRLNGAPFCFLYDEFFLQFEIL